jgi:hypothetical protein
MFGPSSKRALLEIIEQEPGKAGTPPRKPILREGERDGSVEVLAINVEKNQVTIRNGTVETNITFEVQKTAATAAVPGAPPALPTMRPAPPLTAFPPPANPPGAGPTIITRDGVSLSAGSGVTVFGANSATAPASTGLTSPTITTPYGAPNTTTYGASGTATPIGAAQGGLRIPPRQVRNPQDPTGKPMPPLPPLPGGNP